LTTPLTYSEREALTAMVGQVRFSLPHPIATIVDVGLLWDDKMGDCGTLGSYNYMRPREIRLAAHAAHNLPMLVPVLCHELRHMHQHHCHRLWYVLATIPGLRNWTIEPSAYEVQAAAEKLIFK
jgi:hypothetical protein